MKMLSMLLLLLSSFEALCFITLRAVVVVAAVVVDAIDVDVDVDVAAVIRC